MGLLSITDWKLELAKGQNPGDQKDIETARSHTSFQIWRTQIRLDNTPYSEWALSTWERRQLRMADVTILAVPVIVAGILAVLRTVHWFRGRAMFALASRLGFRYIGPRAPATWWWNPSEGRTGPKLPSWVSNVHPCGLQVRQIWKVMEGQRNGVSILIFDAIYGSKGGQPFTVVVCRTEQDPFLSASSAERAIQSHGWAALYGSLLLLFSWTMRTRRIAEHINNLQL